MRSQTYLYRQSRHYHFRRRIPRLSTSIRPVRIALGTTGEKTAHTWSRTLITEFEAMLDAFLFVLDPLPEELIAQYMDARLKQALKTLRRQSRMERMSGRSATPGTAAPIQRAVIESLLKDGIKDGFPASRLNPTWCVEEVRGAVNLYAKEVAILRTPQSRTEIFAEFAGLTGMSAKSAEHEYQILEAYLHAKLAAFGAEQDAQTIRAKLYENRATRCCHRRLSFNRPKRPRSRHYSCRSSMIIRTGRKFHCAMFRRPMPIQHAPLHCRQWPQKSPPSPRVFPRSKAQS